MPEEEIATKSGMTPSILSRILSGKRAISLPELYAFAAAIKVSPLTLMAEIDRIKPLAAQLEQSHRQISKAAGQVIKHLEKEQLRLTSPSS